MSSLLWYVSYGSNLSSQRFGCYLHGGTPAGGRRAMPGCRDPRPARDSRPVELSYALWFGGPSKTWNGGPAFLDLDTPGRTIARGWLVTVDQFADVVAQENYRPVGTVDVSAELLTHGGVLLPDSRYGRLVAVDPIDGLPAVTFTYTRRPARRAPDPAYLAMLRDGLAQLSHSDAAVDAYLASQPQLRDASCDDVATTLR